MLKPPGKFINSLVVTPTNGGRRFTLMQPFGYRINATGEVITVNTGYVTDFASVPRLFWRIFPPWGRYSRAAVVHDWLCDVRDRPSPDVHKIFREAMKTAGVPAWKRWVMWSAVRCCGPRFEGTTK